MKNKKKGNMNANKAEVHRLLSSIAWITKYRSEKGCSLFLLKLNNRTDYRGNDVISKSF